MFFKPFFTALALVSIIGSAHAQLQARDINHDGSIDAFYDVQQNISWLADANYLGTLGYATRSTAWGPAPPAGIGMWTEVNTWIGQLNVHGVADWRLPNVILPTEPIQAPWCPILFCSGFISLESELTGLYDQLGGQFDSFLNVQTTYWTGSYTLAGGDWVLGGQPSYAQYVNTSSGSSFGTDELQAGNALAFAWAVRDGDVGTVSPIPEPSTYALMLAGLVAVVFMARRRRETATQLAA